MIDINIKNKDSNLKRPWITPDDIRGYTLIEDIKKLDNNQLSSAIMRAESDIIQYIGHDFTGEKYKEIPQEVILADKILAEKYAYSVIQKNTVAGIKSESFDDYSYTRYDREQQFENLGLDNLLRPFLKKGIAGNAEIMLRMRRL